MTFVKIITELFPAVTDDVPDPGSSQDDENQQRKIHPEPDGSNYDQLVTHLPDQVIFADHNRALPYQITQQGVLLFLDISGIKLN